MCVYVCVLHVCACACEHAVVYTIPDRIVKPCNFYTSLCSTGWNVYVCVYMCVSVCVSVCARVCLSVHNFTDRTVKPQFLHHFMKHWLELELAQ